MKKLMFALPLFVSLLGCSGDKPEAAAEAAAPAGDAAAANPHAMPDAAAGYQHPTPAATADMLIPEGQARNVEMTNEGTVVQNIKAAEYSYIEVQQNGQTRWLAATQNDAAPGDKIRFENGMEMTNFYSKTLQRNFPSVLFIGHMEVVK